MDSSSDEEEYEYFETLEDISSSSTSDSGNEVDEHLNEGRVEQLNAKGKLPNGSSLESKYAVWRNDPRSIRERRKDLFQLMGLQDQRQYLKADKKDSSPAICTSATATATAIQGSSSRSTSLSIPPASGASPASSESSNVDVVALQGSRIRSFVKESETAVSVSASVSASADSCAFGRSASWDEFPATKQSSCTISRSRSDNKGRDSLLRGIKTSFPDKPVLERFLDTSGAVLREDPAFSSKSEVQKDINNKAFQRKHKEGFGLRTRPPVPLPLCSAVHEGEISSFPTRELWTEPSSSSGRSIADISQGVEDPRSSQEISKELVCRVKDLDTGKEFVVHELGTDGLWNKLREVGTGREFTLEEFEKSLGLSPIAKEVRKRARAAGVRSENGGKLADTDGIKHKKKGWLRSITNVAHYVKVPKEKKIEGCQGSDGKQINIPDANEGTSIWRPQKVKVRVHRKDMKEFSELYMGQEFKAHEGPIWALKFSLDGHHFATGGQDCLVRVWQIKDHQSTADRGSEDPPSSKPSEARASEVNGASQPSKSFWIWGDERRSRRGAVGRSNSAKAVQFPKVFSIVEKAVRCFAGHTGDILDLAWSRSQFLLSSSMDKTVRLWHVLHDDCLRIFSHSDYVTCIEFNPVDERYFISGSLDDKVRIWSILDHQVVDWMDMREMVTAACFTPDGKGAVVGTYKGTCRIYKITGNKLQLDAHVAVKNAKRQKSRGKKITGLQFMPGNITKMLITSNDSRIRVFDGVELDCKFKGFRNASSQMSASFSSDGHYIVSASEDSRVYIWNTSDASSITPKVQRKKTSQATENFYSQNVTVAMPWPGTSILSFPDISKELNGDKWSLWQLKANTIDPINGTDVVDNDALSSLTSTTKHDHEHETPVGASNSKMTSKQSSFTSIYFDCLSVGVTGDVIERTTADTPRMNGYSWTNKTSCEPSGRRSLRKSRSQSSTTEFSALDVLSAADSSLVGSPTSYVTDKDLSCMSSGVPNESCDTVVKASAAWSRLGLAQHLPKLAPEVTALDAPVGTESVAAEDVSKTQVTVASPACDLIIVTASLDGDIRIYQNSKSVI